MEWYWLAAIYMVLASALWGVLTGIDEVMSPLEEEDDRERVEQLKLILFCSLWGPALVGLPFLFLARWRVRRDPKVIARRLVMDKEDPR